MISPEPAVQFRHLDVEANGLTHHVLEWAPGSAAHPLGTALLLHGYLDAAGTFDTVAPRLARAGLRVVAPDLRGFGAAPRAPAGSYYHFPDYVADVEGLARALAPRLPGLSDPAPLHVIGHSMGGTVATLFAGAFPDRVSKLALLEGVGSPDAAPESAPARMRAWVEQVRAVREGRGRGRAFSSRDDARRRLAMNHPQVPLEVLDTRLDALTRDAGDGALAWAFDPLHKTRAPMLFFASVYRAFARNVSCPVLYVSGGEKGYRPSDLDERLAEFKSLERREVGGGHMMHWTRAEALSAELVAFLSGGPPR